MHPDPDKRYESLSEYLFDLRHPNPNFLGVPRRPLIERNPLLFWKCATAILACVVLALLAHPSNGGSPIARAFRRLRSRAIIGFGARPAPGFMLNS